MAADTDFGDTRARLISADAYNAGFEKMGRRRDRRGPIAATILVYALLVGFLALNVLNFAIAERNRSTGDDLKTMVTEQYNPSFKVRYGDLGAQIITAWYAGTTATPPIALASGISWPSATAASTATASDAPTPSASPSASTSASAAAANSGNLAVSSVALIGGQQIATPGRTNAYQEQLLYTALVGSQWYNVALAIGVPASDRAGDQDAGTDAASVQPVLLSSPTLTPIAAQASSDTTSAVGVPAGWHSVDQSDSLKTQIAAWAKAWTEDDTAGLKSVTGDSSQDSYYAGITPDAWTVPAGSTPTINWAYQRDATYAVASVTWQMQLPSTTTTDSSGGSAEVPGAIQTQRMDVLIAAADSGLPRVVAWGAEGSYPVLTPTTNVLTQAQFNALPARTDSSN